MTTTRIKSSSSSPSLCWFLILWTLGVGVPFDGRQAVLAEPFPSSPPTRQDTCGVSKRKILYRPTSHTQAPVPPAKTSSPTANLVEPLSETNPPTLVPTTEPPTHGPTELPTVSPTRGPTTMHPTSVPTQPPSKSPTTNPTAPPSLDPTSPPTRAPMERPTVSPTDHPTVSPTSTPTEPPTKSPSKHPTSNPTELPTMTPTNPPTDLPTSSPTRSPTNNPTTSPTKSPTNNPTTSPTTNPTLGPSNPPTGRPTNAPTGSPSKSPTKDPTLTPTLQPVDPVPGTGCDDRPINICIAIDMSGSICSPPDDVGSCRQQLTGNPCISKCRDLSLDKTTCCGNYKKEHEFAVDFINRFSSGHIHNSERQFSLVTFGTDSFIVQNLTDSTSDTIAELETLVYGGGGTNTGGAIKNCFETLKDETDEENVIVLMTDGTPTKSVPGYDSAGHLFYAQIQANNAKSAGMRLATVAINTGHLKMDTLKSLSSGEDYVIGVSSFDSLDMDIVDKLAALVKCGDVAEGQEESPTLSPTMPLPTGSPLPDLSDCGEKDFDICIAIDMSGSICSPENHVQTCRYPSYSCVAACQQSGFSRELCCYNHEMEREFATKFISTMDSYGGTQRFSLVTFADDGHQVMSLQTADLANYDIDRLVYTGGKTNTGEAIKNCHDFLSNGHAPNKAMIILTDGKPTASYEGNEDHMGYARQEATSAKLAGITVMAVTVDTPHTDMDKIRQLASSDNFIVEVVDFTNLNVEKVNELVQMVKCEPGTPFISSMPVASWSLSPVTSPVTQSPTSAPSISTPIDWVISGEVATYESDKAGWDGVYCSSGDCAYDSKRVYDPSNCPGGSYCWRLRDHSDGWTSKMYKYFDDFTGSETKGKVVFDFKATGFSPSRNQGMRVITRCTEYHPGFSGSTSFIERADLQCCGNGASEFQNDRLYDDWEVEFDLNGCKRVKIVFECTGWNNWDKLWIDNVRLFTKTPHAVTTAATPAVVYSDEFTYGMGSWNCYSNSASYCNHVHQNSNCDGSNGSCVRLSGDQRNVYSKMWCDEFSVTGKSEVRLSFHFQSNGLGRGMKLELYSRDMDNDGWNSWTLETAWVCGSDFEEGVDSGDINQLVTVPSGARNMKLYLKLLAYDEGNNTGKQMYIDTITVHTLS